jgi:hypothetical protein
MDICTCGRISVGLEVTEHRNWNPDCIVHGINSEWYNTDEQIQRRDEQNRRLRELQLLAAQKRKQAKQNDKP